MIFAPEMFATIMEKIKENQSLKILKENLWTKNWKKSCAEMSFYHHMQEIFEP